MASEEKLVRCNACGYLYLVNEEEVRYRHPSIGLIDRCPMCGCELYTFVKYFKWVQSDGDK